MDAVAFAWLPRRGFAPGAVFPAGVSVPKPLEAEALDGATLAWLPLDHRAAAQRVLAALPRPAFPLFPYAAEQVPAVVDAWLGLYAMAPAGMREAVLQVTDDPAHLATYLDAEEALWKEIYAAHPHTAESEGLYPRALAEARWLADAVLGHAAYGERAEFLTMSALETVARELLLTVRKAELLHLRDHLQGRETVMGW